MLCEKDREGNADGLKFTKVKHPMPTVYQGIVVECKHGRDKCKENNTWSYWVSSVVETCK